LSRLAANQGINATRLILLKNRNRSYCTRKDKNSGFYGAL